jgi:hypothetical protein
MSTARLPPPAPEDEHVENVVLLITTDEMGLQLIAPPPDHDPPKLVVFVDENKHSSTAREAAESRT